MTVTETAPAKPETKPADRGELAFTTTHPALSRALADLKPFVLARMPLPILKSVLLEHDQAADVVRLTVWDYETAATTELPVSPGATGGRALIAHDVLTKMLAAAAKGESKRDLEKTEIGVTAADGRGAVTAAGFELPVELGDLIEYPRVIAPAEPVWAGSLTETRAQLERALVAAGSDNTLPMLTGLHLSTDGGTLIAACTDRFRLSETRSTGAGQLEAPVLVPASAIGRALKRFTGDTFTLGVAADRGSGYVTVSDGTLTITTRTLDAEFPRVAMLWPKGGQTVTVDRAALVSMVTKAKNLGEVMPGEGGSIVLLAFAGDSLTVTPRRASPDGDGKAKGRELTATCDGEGHFALSGEFVLDALSVFDGDRLTLLCTRPDRPVLLLDDPSGADGSLGRRYLQMPYRMPEDS